MTFLEVLHDQLGDTAGDVCLALVPRFGIELARSNYHHHRYELPKVTSGRDQIEALLDLGDFGLSNIMLVEDLLERLDTLNGHLQQLQEAMYTADDVSLSDTMVEIKQAIEGVSSGETGWTAESVTALINVLTSILATL